MAKTIVDKFTRGSIFAIPGDAPNIAHAVPGTPAGFQTVVATPIHLGHSEGKFLVKDRVSEFKAGTSGDGHRNFLWLPYIPGFVSEVAQTNLPVITGPLSGCPTTRYLRGGQYYVGHPGTADEHGSADSVAARGYWNAFAGPLAAGQCTGVNVLNDLLEGGLLAGRANMLPGDGAFKCWAIVMPSGDYYGLGAYSQFGDPNRSRPKAVGAGGTAWWRVAVPPFKITNSVFPADGIMV